jgi:hypothetical protein
LLFAGLLGTLHGFSRIALTWHRLHATWSTSLGGWLALHKSSAHTLDLDGLHAFHGSHAGQERVVNDWGLPRLVSDLTRTFRSSISDFFHFRPPYYQFRPCR